MNQGILSVTTGQRGDARIQVGPSPTLDLLYGCHYLSRMHRRPGEVPSWADDLAARAQAVVEAASAALAGPSGSLPLRAAFGLAMDEGYVGDSTPERFLDDLPALARTLRERSEAGSDASLSDDLRAFVLDNDPETWSAALARALRPLWGEVSEYWTGTGAPLAEDAAREVERRLDESGDVMRALPSHHFAQFETLASKLRDQARQGPLFIVPLVLAAGGGFHLESARAAALGFGLQAEDIHARTEAQVSSVARRAKALADPTRLMLLSLLARYPGTQVTVGDLARQLAVSQPTVSGHLKTLREAGLIRVERQGNRSLPVLERDAVKELLDALDGVLHRPDLS